MYFRKKLWVRYGPGAVQFRRYFIDSLNSWQVTSTRSLVLFFSSPVRSCHLFSGCGVGVAGSYMLVQNALMSSSKIYLSFVLCRGWRVSNSITHGWAQSSVFGLYSTFLTEVIKFGSIGLYKSFEIYSVASDCVLVVMIGELGFGS